MKLIPTAIPDVIILQPQMFEDERGWFMESYNQHNFHSGLEQLGMPRPRPFVQDNHSCSRKGVLRGLHYQLPPHAQGKLVRVAQGAVFDVAVDIRPNSPTFGQWVSAELSDSNHQMLWIPEGFAHGFVALENNTHLLYKTTDFYAKGCEAAIRWDDPKLGIEWPKTIQLVMNQKDREAPLL
ncbi:dTDP-4-dehydrorhamnose 3,5-epimerase [Shewanella sp.]|uniref:dTDP-4-dehydrorhamnose 3,5-epimerase n=1 Tax=Shewanella sp. TaxID=50422 RepID=UPI003A969FB6